MTGLLILLGQEFAYAFYAGPEDLSNFDKRLELLSKSPKTEQSPAVSEFSKVFPEASVSLDSLLQVPRWIGARHNFLSGPNGQGRGISPVTLARIPVNDPYRVTKAFVLEHKALFGHGPELLDAAKIKRDYVTAHNGLHTVVWEQEVDGIPVFEALFVSHTSRRQELLSISSHFVPAADKAAAKETANRTALLDNPPVSATKALEKALQNIGENLSSPVHMEKMEVEGPVRHQRLQSDSLQGDADIQLIWLPINRNSLRLCWRVIFTSRERGEMFLTLIDVKTGSPWLRRKLTENISDAAYRVYTTESPSPQSPGYSTPSTNQPGFTTRSLVVISGLNTNASPNGWINDGDNETSGNNVAAQTDRDADNLPDLPRPRGAPFRVFDLPMDLAQDPLTHGDASVVNLFYWCNWMHDKLYEYGFTEGAGNFQVNNFGRGGSGNDPVMADAQDGSGFNNANFSTPPDGMPGRLQMFIFNGPTPNRDGDLDTQVILHEYAHGLSSRLVGGGAGISDLQSRGLGEGWSDFYSLALLSKPEHPLNANYPEGAYSTYRLFGLQENYYFGIRRYPYSTDMLKSPLTLKDIDPGLAEMHEGIPRNPVIINSPTEIHNLGEVWCAALWDARANLITKYGFEIGNPLSIQLVTDAMNLTPANPTFIEARDALLQADLINHGAIHYHELWQAFAKRGMGADASVPSSVTTSGVIESFSTPDELLVTPISDVSSGGTITGPFSNASQNYTLINTGTNALDWSAGATMSWVNLSATAGTLTGLGDSTNILISLNNSASNLAVGVYTGIVAFTNLETGISRTRVFTLTVSPPRLLHFSLDEDPGWTKTGEWAFGVPSGAGGSGHGNPDPISGATGTNVFGVNLNGDYFTGINGPYYLVAGPFDFSNDSSVVLKFQRWLNTDYPPYANAGIEASSNGIDWTPIFANGGVEIADSSWLPFEYNISTIADGQPSFYLRWSYQISPGAFAYSGWNIDDIEFLGVSQLSVVIPPDVSEAEGTGTGSIAVVHAPSVDVAVNLTSSNPAIIVPPSVTILAGETNASFSFTIVDDSLLNGTNAVEITASAAGYISGSNTVAVLDDDGAVLTFYVPSNVVEGSGLVEASVNASTEPLSDFIITLSSSNTNLVQVPETVLLSAGQTSAVFNLTILDDTKISWNQNVTITAHVNNWVDGNADILVYENEDTNIVVELPSQLHESNGLLVNAGKVKISAAAFTNVLVNLASSNTNEILVPPSVMISVGQTSALFNLELLNDHQADGTKEVQITASAPGLGAGESTISVLDDATPSIPIYLSPANLSTTNTVSLQLSWSPGLGEGVELITNGNFEVGILSGWIVSGGTNGNCIINDGTVDPQGPEVPVEPYSGDFSLLMAPDIFPGSAEIYQDVTIPAVAGSVTLNWTDQINNFHSVFDTNQEFKVEIRNTNNTLLGTVFSTQPGSPLSGDWVERHVSLSAYRGQTIRLAFILEAGMDYMDVHLDNIGILSANPPPTSYDVFFGTDPVPGPAQLIGNTTNTFWALAGLDADTTYYWQIVAKRTIETPGPVWQFGTRPTLFINDHTLLEGDTGSTNIIVSVTLSASNGEPVTVDFSTVDGTATAPADYSSTNGTLIFNPGETNHSFSIAIHGDATDELNETFLIQLSNPAGAVLARNQATVTILDDDNGPPSLTQIPDSAGGELTSIVITNVATDTDFPQQVLTYSLEPGAPVGAVIDPVTGVFSWTPTEAQGPGNYTISVRVTDDGSPPLNDIKTFILSINEVNSAPAIAVIPDWVVHAESAVSFTVAATDTDLPTNHLTFSLDAGAATGANINSENGHFTWTPTDSNIGTNQFTITVTDDGLPNLSDFKIFKVIVMPRPTLTGISVVGTSVLLGWSTIPGKSYRVQYKNLITDIWHDISGDITAFGYTAGKTDNSGLATTRFYRVVLLQ